MNAFKHLFISSNTSAVRAYSRLKGQGYDIDNEDNQQNIDSFLYMLNELKSSLRYHFFYQAVLYSSLVFTLVSIIFLFIGENPAYAGVGIAWGALLVFWSLVNTGKVSGEMQKTLELMQAHDLRPLLLVN